MTDIHREQFEEDTEREDVSEFSVVRSRDDEKKPFFKSKSDLLIKGVAAIAVIVIIVLSIQLIQDFGATTDTTVQGSSDKEK